MLFIINFEFHSLLTYNIASMYIVQILCAAATLYIEQAVSI